MSFIFVLITFIFSEHALYPSLSTLRSLMTFVSLSSAHCISHIGNVHVQGLITGELYQWRMDQFTLTDIHSSCRRWNVQASSNRGVNYGPIQLRGWNLVQPRRLDTTPASAGKSFLAMGIKFAAPDWEVTPSPQLGYILVRVAGDFLAQLFS